MPPTGFRDNAALFALGLTVVGATSLLGGTACLVLETNYAIGSLREEIDFTLQHPEERQALGPESSPFEASARPPDRRVAPPPSGRSGVIHGPAVRPRATSGCCAPTRRQGRRDCSPGCRWFRR